MLNHGSDSIDGIIRPISLMLFDKQTDIFPKVIAFLRPGGFYIPFVKKPKIDSISELKGRPAPAINSSAGPPS